MSFVERHKLYLAWLIALVGVLISLYYSELERFEPCRLCWLQRTLLFPLAIQLGMAAYQSDERGAWYAQPLAWIGCAIALLQLVEPWLGLQGLCGGDCDRTIPLIFGVPFPLLSAVGFAAIGLILAIKRKIRAL